MTENTSNLSQERRLLAEKKKQAEQGSMTAFNAVAIEVGIPVRPHFPSLKDKNGKTIKDENGYAKKSERSDGFSYVLAVFGKQQFVHVVLQKQINLKPACAYSISGYGFDIGKDFYVKEDAHIRNY